MLKISKIKDEAQYRLYVEEVGRLIELDNHERTEEDRSNLEILAHLVELFEKERFPITPPSSIEAIRFRMEQMNLSPKDLIPYIGSHSRVSEVLSGKRSLTKKMIKSLNKGLGIPLDSLLNEVLEQEGVEYNTIHDPRKYPLAKMRTLGWIDCTISDIRSNPDKVLDKFLEPLGGSFLHSTQVFAQAGIRNQRIGDGVNKHSLLAWIAQVCKKAIKYTKESPIAKLSEDFLKEIVSLSVHEQGPIKAQHCLAEKGISLIIERHLPSTRLDGATFRYKDRTIIGMTIRYDRLDNFWFTLMHELVHVQKHLNEDNPSFLDDLDFHPYELDPREAEADMGAYETILPSEIWETSKAFNLRNEQEIRKLAQKQGIHPAILFGRLQKEIDDYRSFRYLVGQGTVRTLFKDVRWNI